MKTVKTLTLLTICVMSIALADDFKTVNGKEYKNATVSRIEPDGVVLKHESGISKVYFSELPKEVQERFHYNPAKAAQFIAAEQAATTAAARAYQDTVAVATVEKSAMEIRAKVLQLTEDGVLASYYASDSSGWIPEKMPDPILIVGLPSTLVDGDSWQGVVYIAGNYRNGDRTIRRWATDKEKALELCKEWVRAQHGGSER